MGAGEGFLVCLPTDYRESSLTGTAQHSVWDRLVQYCNSQCYNIQDTHRPTDSELFGRTKNLKQCSRKEKCVLKKDRAATCSRWAPQPSCTVSWKNKPAVSINISGQGESPVKSCWLFFNTLNTWKPNWRLWFSCWNIPPGPAMALSKHCPGLIPPSRWARWQSPKRDHEPGLSTCLPHELLKFIWERHSSTPPFY